MNGLATRSLIIRMFVVLFLLLAVFAGRKALGQANVAAAQSQETRTNQLPLSGRSPQNGSVTATQSANPGGTSSVNTLNPTVQVQGPYSGSTAGFTTQPFSGKLRSEEAIQRGLVYNLGAVSLTQTVNQAHGQARVVRA